MTTVVHVASGESLDVLEVLGWADRVTVPTVVHRVIGSGTPDFTIVPAGPRAGTYRFLLWDGTTAAAVTAFLERPGAFAVTGADAAFADAAFYVTGDIVFTLDEDTLERVVVEVDWTEVS